MDAKTRNRMLFYIVTKTSYYLNQAMNENKNFFALNAQELINLIDIANAINIRPGYGKTRARTLWERANKGRPF